MPERQIHGTQGRGGLTSQKPNVSKAPKMGPWETAGDVDEWGQSRVRRWGVLGRLGSTDMAAEVGLGTCSSCVCEWSCHWLSILQQFFTLWFLSVCSFLSAREAPLHFPNGAPSKIIRPGECRGLCIVSQADLSEWPLGSLYPMHATRIKTCFGL